MDKRRQDYVCRNTSSSKRNRPEWKGTYFALYRFGYGYADNELNDKDASAIDIDWAVDSKGQPANLPGVDFIRIHTGVNQENGWLGECSTEIMGVTDLHLTNVSIKSQTIKN